ncbi:hypothetical protein BZG36_01028 [Bifiguratus adelaidae]|uniref:Probable RNA polymerase II nuclear localization protein SLC7A6OS n=1 Tax=Bifiguratus adelaidae TaxID=1938954 RepID=A0A261Y6Q6_9FUNG|nr:hypothetical protein BZG36_01028 [Bifiguratus adelaidae]
MAEVEASADYGVNGKTTEAQSADAQPTILRIKRKRTEEPLDALLVQQHANGSLPYDKKSRKGSVTDSTADGHTLIPSLFTLVETVEESSLKDSLKTEQLRARIAKLHEKRYTPSSSRTMTPEPINDRRTKLAAQQMRHSKEARYRIVSDRRYGKAGAPKDSEEANGSAMDFLEAIKDDGLSRRKGSKDITSPNVDDDVYCNLMPMVKEYLTLNEQAVDQEPEYVYDIYYSNPRGAEAAMAVSSNIGSLLWVDEDELMNDSDDSSVADEADEDSNAEDYYQNDYPDEDEEYAFSDVSSEYGADDDDLY